MKMMALVLIACTGFVIATALEWESAALVCLALTVGVPFLM
jgi:hypothetical protein